MKVRWGDPNMENVVELRPGLAMTSVVAPLGMPEGQPLLDVLHNLQRDLERQSRAASLKRSPGAAAAQRKLLRHLREAEIQAMILMDEGAKS